MKTEEAYASIQNKVKVHYCSPRPVKRHTPWIKTMIREQEIKPKKKFITFMTQTRVGKILLKITRNFYQLGKNINSRSKRVGKNLKKLIFEAVYQNIAFELTRKFYAIFYPTHEIVIRKVCKISIQEKLATLPWTTPISVAQRNISMLDHPFQSAAQYNIINNLERYSI